MRDNQLMNFTGLPGHSMGVDLNIEHLIGELKVSMSVVLFLCHYSNNRFPGSSSFEGS